MTVRRLVNNDYSFGNGQADFITGLDECLQTCRTTLMQLKGEWFLDGRDGVAWGDVLAHKEDRQLLEQTVKKHLLSVNGVTKVESLHFELEDRHAILLAKLTTDFGTTNFNQSLNVLELLAYDTTNK